MKLFEHWNVIHCAPAQKLLKTPGQNSLVQENSRPEIFSEYSVFLLPYAVADKNCMQSCLCVVMLGTAASFQLLHAGGTSTPAKEFYSV